MLFEPVDSKTTRLSLMSNCDPKVHVPYSIINTVTKKFAHHIFVVSYKLIKKYH